MKHLADLAITEADSGQLAFANDRQAAEHFADALLREQMDESNLYRIFDGVWRYGYVGASGASFTLGLGTYAGVSPPWLNVGARVASGNWHIWFGLNEVPVITLDGERVQLPQGANTEEFVVGLLRDVVAP